MRTEINELPNPSVRLMKATAALKLMNTERLEIIRFIDWKKYDRIHGKFLRELLRTPPTRSANKLTELELGRDSRQRRVL